MTPRTATIGDTPIRWLEQDGDGTPIVLVHGIPTSPALWRHVTPRLNRHRILAFEMTGYGESIPAGTDRDISVSAHADRLLAWLDHLGIASAILVGHDLGGGGAHRRRSPTERVRRAAHHQRHRPSSASRRKLSACTTSRTPSTPAVPRWLARSTR
jgi:hypothetical protein